MRLPKTLGGKIDFIYNLRAERLALQKKYAEEIESLKQQEKSIQEVIIAELKANKMESGRGADCTATISPKVLPQVTDWDSVYAWVKKTGAFEIFEKRISRSAFKERWEAGEGVPGVEAMQVMDLSLTKAGGKK